GADGRLRRPRIGADQRQYRELRGSDIEPRHEQIVFSIGGELRSPEGIAETAVQRSGGDRFRGLRQMVVDHNHYDHGRAAALADRMERTSRHERYSIWRIVIGPEMVRENLHGAVD